MFWDMFFANQLGNLHQRGVLELQLLQECTDITYSGSNSVVQLDSSIYMRSPVALLPTYAVQQGDSLPK
jgi:hypothetical protein